MIKLKKIAMLCLSLIAALAVSAGCALSGGGENSSSDESPSSESTASESVKGDDGDENPDDGDDGDENPDDGDGGNENPDDGNGGNGGVTPPVDIPHDVCEYEWKLTQPFSCTQAGEMTEVCKYNANHTREVESIPARGHDYNDNGLCKCGATPTVPTLPTEGYITPTDTASGVALSNPSETYGMYNRYVLAVDTPYTAEMTATEAYNDATLTYYTEYAFWFQFSIPEPGQYAVVSHDNPNGLTITRYDANSQYVNPAKLSGGIMDDGNFISTVDCNATYFNEEWLTVCCIRGVEVGQTVNFSIVKVDKPAWTAENQYVEMHATQINGKKAPEGAVGTKPAEVPYETNGIYYSEDDGYYHMPEGDIIYAAISMAAPRQFGNNSNMNFTSLLLEGSATNFRAHITTLPNGNPLIRDYIPFIMADPTCEGIIYNENSYQAMVNGDGLYPVTQELYEFLKLHAANNRPHTPPEAKDQDNAWLSVCYYYKELQQGSAEYPYLQTEVGTFTATRYNKYAPVYYTFKYTPETESAEAVSTTCFISINTDGVTLTLNGVQYQNKNGVFGIQNIPFEVSSVRSVTFELATDDINVMDITVSITYAEGSLQAPIAINLGEQSLTCMKILNMDGEYKYETCYVYTATADGTLTLTSSSTDVAAMLGSSVLNDGEVSVTVTAGERVIIYVSTPDGASVDANLTFTAA